MTNKPQISQAEKGRRFRELHERAGAFIIPNPWDVGTARVLAKLGFEDMPKWLVILCLAYWF